LGDLGTQPARRSNGSTRKSAGRGGTGHGRWPQRLSGDRSLARPHRHPRPRPRSSKVRKANNSLGGVSWRRVVDQTDQRGKAGDPRSLRSWSPAFPFFEGPFGGSLGGRSWALLADVLHDVRHASRVTADTPCVSTPAAGQAQTGRREAPVLAKPPALPAPPTRGALPPAPIRGGPGSGGPQDCESPLPCGQVTCEWTHSGREASIDSIRRNVNARSQDHKGSSTGHA
jgi:hypothetical protein